MEKIDFKKITDILILNYGKEINSQILGIWYEELKDYPKERYEFAIKQIIKKENFMPNLSKVFEYMKSSDWLNMDVPINPATEEEIAELERRMKR